MSEDSDLIPFPKELAAIGLTRTSDARKFLIEQHSSSFRWLNASFLALNSGGLFLLKDMQPYSGSWAVAGVSFYLGIAFALAVGWINQERNTANSPQIAILESFWATVTATGLYSLKEHARITDDKKIVGARPGRWFAWLSFIAFTTGLLAIGCHTMTVRITSEIAHPTHDQIIPTLTPNALPTTSTPSGTQTHLPPKPS